MRIDVFGNFWYVLDDIDIVYHKYNNNVYTRLEMPSNHRIDFLLEFYE